VISHYAGKCAHVANLKIASCCGELYEADVHQKRLKSSRSKLYSRALGEFLRRHAPDRVTEAMDEVIAAVGDATDAFSRRAARQVLRKVEW